MEKILDKLLVNNDINIVKNIMDYMYNECCDCGEYIVDEKEPILRYDDKHICKECFKRIDWKPCYTCSKYFDKKVNVYCICCLSGCGIYCWNCLSESSRIN